MVRYYEIESIQDAEKEVFGVFDELEPGTTIKWGGNSREADGLKQWRVIQEI